jgi:Holliday junction resolvase RusA-like endonuclease
MTIEFFLPMKPPTVTHQEKDIRVVNGKPVVYEPQELKQARSRLMAYLASHAPDESLCGPLRLIVKWCFPITGKHQNGEYKTSRPDTDNLQKLLKDCMTDLHFWKDDAQVASEIVEKFWADKPGIFIIVDELGSIG